MTGGGWREKTRRADRLDSPPSERSERTTRHSPPRLTRQEERAGLLDETATIGTRSGWSDRLRSMGYALSGHRLVRSKSRDCLPESRVGDTTEDDGTQTGSAELTG